MTKYLLLASLLQSLIFAASIFAQPAPQKADAALAHARKILKSTPLVDGHNDLPWEIRRNPQAPHDVQAYDLRKRTPGHTDLARLKEGLVGAQFWSVYIPGEIKAEGYAKVQLEQIDIARRVIERYPESLALALTAADIEAIFKSGRVASLLGMEGGHAIENSLGALRAFYALGARYMTLTHNVTLDWADAAADAPKHNGLTAFGKEVVREMNRLGMLIDLSHVSPKVMSGALRFSAAPVIFSHSSARALTDHARNVPDSILARLPQNGGVVMVTFVPAFVSQEVLDWEAPIRERLAKAASGEERSRIRKEYETEHPVPKATIAQVAEHIEHVRKVAGVDHVGLGSDFDGTSALPVDLEDVSKFPNLFAELIRRGWSDADLKKLAGENLLRALREAEATAQRLQRIRPPSTATIEKLDGLQTNLQYVTMAAKIVSALKLREGERVLIRFDPGYFYELAGPLRHHIRAVGAVDIGALEYIESAAIQNVVPADEARRAEAQSQAFEQLLEAVDVYLWLPVRTDQREIPMPESLALQKWLDKGGNRRQIHFHWSQGSVLADGLAGEHSTTLDSVYQSALDIDYAALSATQDRAITLLRSGTVRVRTPAGTDLNFRIGERPFNKQNGDASPERMQKAVVRIDREIELPAGVVRVAPLEETVDGRIIIPSARFGDRTTHQLKLEISRGRVIRVEADENLAAVEAALHAGGEAAHRFREFALGFNPKLTTSAASPVLPYFGYGAGVVRLSLGDNQELGGSVRGNFVRWFFFPDATVEIDGQALVREGKLVEGARQN